jgi:hypothetical protein
VRADADREEYLDCVRDAGYPDVVYHQSADRHWRFRWTETEICCWAGRCSSNR